MLIMDQDVWIANTGDSRAIMSENMGAKFTQISNDHKPSEEAEKKRILKAGGQIY
jgi:serine/threonine protein phosphatase PrpC